MAIVSHREPVPAGPLRGRFGAHLPDRPDDTLPLALSKPTLDGINDSR